MSGAVLSAALLRASAAGASEVQILLPTRPIAVSTVSASDMEKINRQIPANAGFALTDSTLQKSAVGPGYTLLPLPAFIYNRNEGAWEGALAPVFRANERGEVEDIFAPLYLHNDLVGETFTFAYYGYRSETREWHAIVSHATKVERNLDLAYKDTGVDDGRYIVSFAANTGKSAFERFFGFGNGAGEGAESNYAMGDANLIVSGGFNLPHSLSLVGTERLRKVSIENGVVSTLPQALAAFPSAPGIDGADVWSQGLTLAYDTRDNPLTPLRGTYATVETEADQNYETDNRYHWWRTTLEARNYQPHADGQAVFVSHVLVDTLPVDKRGLIRQGVPFYERPTLGGETTLRGFGDGRYVSNDAVLFNIEERIALVKRSVLGNLLELEVAPFLDFGRVGSRIDVDGFENFQFNPGLGLRLLARPNIASRVDVAYGHDGFNAFVGLDYPF